MVMMMTNTYLLSNIYTELGTFLSSSTVEIFPDIHFDKCITFPNIMTSNNYYKNVFIYQLSKNRFHFYLLSTHLKFSWKIFFTLS